MRRASSETLVTVLHLGLGSQPVLPFLWLLQRAAIESNLSLHRWGFLHVVLCEYNVTECVS